MENAQLLIRVIGALALIIGLLLLALYGLRRWGSKFQGKGSDLIEVKSVKMLLPKKYLVVVRVGEKNLILGATDHHITLLGSIEEKESAREALG